MGRIASFAYKKSKLIIVLVAILNIVALASLFRFELDTDFLSLFTEGNPKAEEYDQLNEKYQIGEAISVLIEQDDSLLNERNLRNVLRLQEDIEEIDGNRDSLTNLIFFIQLVILFCLGISLSKKTQEIGIKFEAEE